MIKCSVCGRFIAYSDLDRGLAKHELETPDSAYTSETYDSLCPKHYQEEKAASFIKHLERASEIVAGWPEWKRKILQ